MSAGGTYSGTVAVPVQKGTACAVSFDGVWVPASYEADDGMTNEWDYNHKSDIRDAGNNVIGKLYGGKFHKASGKVKIPTASAAAALALTELDTISMAQRKQDGTLDTPVNWMLLDAPELEGSREYVTLSVVAISEEGITPA